MANATGTFQYIGPSGLPIGVLDSDQDTGTFEYLAPSGLSLAYLWDFGPPPILEFLVDDLATSDALETLLLKSEFLSDSVALSDALAYATGLLADAITLQDSTQILFRSAPATATGEWWNPPSLAETLWTPRGANCACGLGHVGPQGCNENWQQPYPYCPDTTWYMTLPDPEEPGYGNYHSLAGKHPCKYASTGQIVWCSNIGTLGVHANFGWIDFPYTGPTPVTENHAFETMGTARSEQFTFSLHPTTDDVRGLLIYRDDPPGPAYPIHNIYAVQIAKTATGWDFAGRTLTLLDTTFDFQDAMGLVLSTSGNLAMAAWTHSFSYGGGGIPYYAISTDGGVTWGAATPVPGIPTTHNASRGGNIVATSTGVAMIVTMYNSSYLYTPAIFVLTYDWNVGWSPPTSILPYLDNDSIGTSGGAVAIAAPHGKGGGDLRRIATVTDNGQFRIWRNLPGVAPTLLSGPESIPGGGGWYEYPYTWGQDLTYYSGLAGDRWLFATGHSVYPQWNLVVSRRMDEAGASWVSSADKFQQVEFGTAVSATEACPNVMLAMGQNYPGTVWISKVTQP